MASKSLAARAVIAARGTDDHGGGCVVLNCAASEAGMLKRINFIVAFFVCLLGQAASIFAASLTVQLFPFTGEVRLRNPGVSPVEFISYSITSPSGKLNGTSGVWKSISDFYDASGNGFIDPVEEWTKFTPSAGANATNLAEGVFVGSGGTLLGQRSVSLGRIWNASAYPAMDLSFDIREPNEQLISISPEIAIDGDYLANLTVDAADYAIWRQYYGSSSVLFADGNLDGAVDTADYIVWRKNFGKSLLGGSAGAAIGSLGTAAVVPEPSTLCFILAALAAMGFSSARRRRRA
jgi:PEP-CTERM motif